MATEAEQTTYTCEVQTGIEYAVHDGVSLRGDLYTPAAPGTYPALVMLHGGGWSAGAPASQRLWGTYLAEHGYTAFAAGYRLAQSDRPAYPQNVLDAKAAVQWLRGQGAAVKAAPERIAVLGNSAGGHIAALVAVTGDAPGFAGRYPADPHADVSTQVQAAVSVYGVYDMVSAWTRAAQSGRLPNNPGDYLGCTPAERPAAWAEASPLTWVSAANNRVPFLLIWGTADQTVDPATQSETFATALERAGGRVVTVPVEGAPHFWFGASDPPQPVTAPGTYNAYVAPRLLAFLTEYL